MDNTTIRNIIDFLEKKENKKQTIWASGNQINQLRQKQSNLLKIVEFQDLIDQATKLNN